MREAFQGRKKWRGVLAAGADDSSWRLELPVVKPVSKTLVLNSDDVEGLPKKIEGVAVISPTEMVVFNDSDFGIEGDKNKSFRISFEEPVLK